MGVLRFLYINFNLRSLIKIFQQFGGRDKLGQDPENDRGLFVEKTMTSTEKAEEWKLCFENCSFFKEKIAVELGSDSIIISRVGGVVGPSKKGKKLMM